MSEEPRSNLDRLLERLKDDSLAARLVRTYRDSESADSPDPAGSMREILRVRLAQVRASLEDT
jgi:hypothetical protein